MRGIVKKFPGTLALDKVDFDLRAGEVHVLLGENGAGKSTLMKILSGAYVKDGGEIWIDGKEVELGYPAAGQENGIGIIYQELSQVPQLTVAENIFLGREKMRKGVPLIDWPCLFTEAEKLLKEIDADFSVKMPVRNLSVARKQMIEIAKALSMNARIIVMDEPTSSLTPHEVERLFGIIRKLKTKGVGVIFISHHLDEVNKIGDRATILRDGCYVKTVDVATSNVGMYIELMVGRTLETKFPKIKATQGKEMLRVENLTAIPDVNNVSLSVRQGEVLGLAGLVGAGRTELCRLIFGADPRDSGKIFIDGQEVRINSPEDAIRNGIGFLTENRKEEGLVLHLSITRNISLPILGSLRREGIFKMIRIIDHARDQAIAEEYFKKLNIRAPSVRKKSGELSGGNQQKVVFAKWIASQSKILIIDEPTRGIDVGAKMEIYNLINKLASEGVAIIMVSSELPELLGMADRIMVMCKGRVTGELTDPVTFTQEEVMKYAVKFGNTQLVQAV
jgi:ribose transport system ATP-binding protein